MSGHVAAAVAITETALAMSTAKHWAELEEFSFLLGMRLLFAIYRIAGSKPLQYCLYPVVIYYWLSNVQARRASLSYLAKVALYLPNPSLKPNCYRSLQHFLCFAEALVDKLAAWSGCLNLADIEYSGREQLQAELDQGRGVLLLAAHLGNLEVCRVIASQNPALKMTVLVHTRHAEKFNRLLKSYNPASQLNLLQVTEINAASVNLLADKIANGELVIIAADRVAVANQQRSSRVEFLGSQAGFPQGPLILAGLLECPVYTLMCLKQDSGYQISFALFSQQLLWGKNQRQQVLDNELQRYARYLEQYCLQAPLHWFNFYDFWQDQA